ncbi:MAG TPA: hypothetical protein VFW68_15285 [Rhodocyclaceae bacterium]|nr:hypothetical protein [Rhodocyclaceae bacterium]
MTAKSDGGVAAAKWDGFPPVVQLLTRQKPGAANRCAKLALACSIFPGNTGYYEDE